ncbi:hypothetical protein [Peribacillus sp. TH14]|uniref:hypothetical protein n=1 Tax=Peribacillus sp. TH14 TaxID=2798481 RepID=UPI0019118628|nr:hypothetical protein [Peribacillus sp. TH14]MBK5502846.1 hypothetical protein [Peribacillus sp. TH14]
MRNTRQNAGNTGQYPGYALQNNPSGGNAINANLNPSSQQYTLYGGTNQYQSR